jgi:hypothetical protein
MLQILKKGNGYGKRLEGKGQRIKDSKRQGFEVSRGRGVE